MYVRVYITNCTLNPDNEQFSQSSEMFQSLSLILSDWQSSGATHVDAAALTHSQESSRLSEDSVSDSSGNMSQASGARKTVRATIKELEHGCSVFPHAFPVFLITHESWLSELRAYLSVSVRIGPLLYLLERAFWDTVERRINYSKWERKKKRLKKGR